MKEVGRWKMKEDGTEMRKRRIIKKNKKSIIIYIYI
jgi:hypothetical protein